VSEGEPLSNRALRFARALIVGSGATLVDFSLLTDPMRSHLQTLLGGSSWWDGPHDSIACERFADAVSWAYWPSPDNVLRPDRPVAAQLRAMLSVLLPGASGRSTASVARRHRAPKG